MRTSKFQRVLAALLVLTLTLGLMVPVMAAEPAASDFGTFMDSLKVLEGYADSYGMITGTDPALLVLNYIRTGVAKYTTSSWQTMAGPENTGFTAYVAQQDAANGTSAAALRKLSEFETPNGQLVEFAHMFGAMNMAYYNANNADLGSWAGDLSDLLYYSKQGGAGNNPDLDTMIADIRANYLGVDEDGVSGFGTLDIYGDLDSYYLVSRLRDGIKLSSAMKNWFNQSRSDRDRAVEFLWGRFSGMETRTDVRNAIYSAYSSNLGVQMLEAENGITAEDATLRYACCYAFADYLYDLAEGCLDVDGNNRYYSVFSSTESQIAPGVSQTVKYAYTADEKQVVYYIADVDVSRDDVSVYANYNENDPTKGWTVSRVYDQMLAAQERHSDPESEHYVENYNAVLGVNGDFFNMGTGEPSGVLVMEGVSYHGSNGKPFFAMLKDGTPVIGYGSDWNKYKDQVQEAVSGSAMLVRNGKPTMSYDAAYVNERASRTCVGITRSGKVILMVMDGRQEPFSCGGSFQELAQVMIDAGCVSAINLDGGGSTTFISKAEGSDELSLVNSPSDGYMRNVSSSLMVVSTAVTSNEFHHANVATEYDYLTVNTQLPLEAVGVSVSGNAAEVPENAVWQVSDSSVGTITDGVFTANALGDVEVQLAVDGEVVGKKTLHVVIPDALSIPQARINVIYDVPTMLPLEASYGGNPVAFNAGDVLVIFEHDNAGIINGLEFTVLEEAAYRTVMIGAALWSDFSVMAMTTLKAYRMDEAVFDFDNATDGDMTFAWLREVANSEAQDGNVFQSQDTDNAMELSYVFGLNMEAIDIPEKLQELTGMLSGGPDSTAWDYLLQLAERVSTLTTVQISAQFDPELKVDISGLSFANEYFVLQSATLDETTNTLTLICNWVDQTQAIDPLTANPVCILSGIKAAPKADANWDENDQLLIENSGVVTYDIYLRASQLYSFSSNPINQETYNLYPFVNESVIIGGSAEKGGHFMDTYATFTDVIILDNSARQGWYEKDGQLLYYVDNEPVTGIYLAQDQKDASVQRYYRFDTNGICLGTVTGLFELDGQLYYAINGEGKTGWHTITAGGKTTYYYFNPSNGAAVDGVQKIDGFTYTFTNRELTRGELRTDSRGTRYHWAGAWLTQEWLELDGKMTYAMQAGYFATGLMKRYYTDGKIYWFAFSEDGWWMRDYTGIYEWEGKGYYIENGYVIEYPGLVKIGEDFYYFCGNGTQIKNCTYWVSKGNGYISNGRYTFDADGKLVLDAPVDPTTKPTDPKPTEPTVPDAEKLNGIVKVSDEVWYYYVDGVKTYAGLIIIDGDYYYVNSKGEVVHDCEYWISKNNGYMGNKLYAFDAEGKLIQGGSAPTEPTTKPTTPVEPSEPTEKPDVLNGIVKESEDVWYYYVNGVKTYAGLILVDGDYYYVNSKCQVVHGCEYWISKNNGYMGNKMYAFDADGKLILEQEKPTEPTTKPTTPEEPSEPTEPTEKPDVLNGIVKVSDEVWYYYVDGVKTYAGLIIIDGDYYYVNSKGEVVHGCEYWISKNNGYMGNKMYTFDADGKLVLEQEKPTESTKPSTEPSTESTKPSTAPTEPTEPEEKPQVLNGIVKESESVWYYYVDGVKTYAGLIIIDGYYYYVNSSGQVIHGKEYWISKNNGYMGNKMYTFDAEGRMVDVLPTV